ncbi:MAG: hypothetical protein IKO41_08985 [Lachnospiraceae bacterium]|nr:hypothetical protein [Lachnospiraceae bacterium]
MHHINKENGISTNMLMLSREEYGQLEPFLLKLGVRSRITQETESAIVIQAENVFNNCFITEQSRRFAGDKLSPEGVKNYKK